MVKKSTCCELFESRQRGSVAVESKLEALLDQMQTPDNLNKLWGALSKEHWGKTKERKMSFSTFEGKLNKAKEDIFNNSNH